MLSLPLKSLVEALHLLGFHMNLGCNKAPFCHLTLSIAFEVRDEVYRCGHLERHHQLYLPLTTHKGRLNDRIHQQTAENIWQIKWLLRFQSKFLEFGRRASKQISKQIQDNFENKLSRVQRSLLKESRMCGLCLFKSHTTL